ncbi:MAG TPA: ABC transporter substrate-binding protein [Chloroflexota bacterium]
MLISVALACAPASSPVASTITSSPPTTGPKMLVWGTLLEPKELSPTLGLGGATRPTQEFRPLIHDALVVKDNLGEYRPQLAAELPSIDRQTWRVFPDGTMETTWKLRPNITWHDGTPFTADDLVFSLTLIRDFAGTAAIPGLRQMASASAPDSTTFVIRWSDTSVDADRSPGVGPAPRHLLEEIYQQNDPATFLNSAYFTTDFVGLGPFRLARWDQGSSAEFERFDRYYLGRPALDRVIFRFVGDDSALVSYVLSGAVDVGVPNTSDIGAMLEVRRRWEGTGNTVATDTADSMWYLEIQQRTEFARPANGVTSAAVRHALFQAIDRQALTQAVSEGLVPIADSWFSPNNPLRGQVESAIPQYPYDPQRALTLLSQAGWTRGSDGVLVHTPDGGQFETELWARPGFDSEVQILIDYWKAVGVQAKLFSIPAAKLTDRELTGTYPGGVLIGPPAQDLFSGDRLHSRAIAGPANRWQGRNSQGYSSRQADAVQERLAVAIDPAQRVAAHRDLLAVVFDDLPIMPLHWTLNFAYVLKGITGVTGGAIGWNILTWDKI